MAVSLVAGGVQPLAPDSSTSLEDLTSGIRFYLREMGQNVIEIGKRLILAKSLVRYGEWQAWLEDNFGLTDRTARRFMQIAERFGKTVDVDRFQSSHLTEMLSLPEGEEVKFIEEQAAEGHIVAEMSVKTLRIEIQKYKQQYKAKLASVNVGVESSVTVEQASVGSEQLEEPVQLENVSLVESVEEIAAVASVAESSTGTGVVSDSVSLPVDSKDTRRVGQNLLEQFFGMMKSLAIGGNLQNLVEQSAEKDSQALKDNLKQCSALYGAIQAHFAQWQRDKDTSVVTAVDEMADGEDVETVEENVVAETDGKAPIVEETAAVSVDKGGDNENSLESFVGKICDKKSDSDRHSIISALYQIALNDDENFTRTEYMASLMEGKGFEVVHQMSTKELYTVLYFTALKFHIYT